MQSAGGQDSSLQIVLVQWTSLKHTVQLSFAFGKVHMVNFDFEIES